jgi:hypothetical protein
MVSRMKQIVAVFLCVASSLMAQPSLKPHIGQRNIPADTDTICRIPLYLGGFDASGLDVGDTAYDFTLFDANGDSLNLATVLSQGKPILLISSSYTCPVFRGKVPAINAIVSRFAGKVEIYIIYTVEAHPQTDTSPYFGRVQTGSTNVNAGILYRQPTTYGERKAILAEMTKDLTIDAPIVIDGPCNEWWQTYGPAPNNATVIDTNGIVRIKHGWFDRYPENMTCDLNDLLGIPDSCGQSPGDSSKGSFRFTMLSSDTAKGDAGQTLSVDAELVNESENDVFVLVRRLENDLPTGWETSLCLDVCYSTTTDSTTILLPAKASQSFHFYFYTSDGGAAKAHARVGLRNVNDKANSYSQDLYAVATPALAVHQSDDVQISISPQPAIDHLTITAIPAFKEIEIFDMLGRREKYIPFEERVDITSLTSGVYTIVLYKASGLPLVRQFIKQ